MSKYSFSEKKLISIIIVNWNGKKLLEKCLGSLSESIKFATRIKRIGLKVEVLVVDNGSTDSSKEYVEKNFPRVKLIENQKNLGFAKANNQGFDRSRGEYILFLNNDTVVNKNFLKELVKVCETDNKIGGAQSKILLLDDKNKLDSVGAFFTNTGFLYHYGFGKKDTEKYNKEIYLYSTKGACMIFKRKVLNEIRVNDEIFDERYFAYFEETDLCHRVWLNGYKIVYVPSSVILHKVGATSKKIDDSFVQYHSFKNRINSYIKNLSGKYLIKILPFHLSLCMIALLSYLIRGRLKVFFAIVSALFWNVTHLKESLIKRKIIQNKIRKLKDDDFLPGLTKSIGINYFIAHLKGLESYEE